MRQISSKELKDLLQANDKLLLLDVREDYEHEAFNIGGKLIPLPDIINRVDEIPRADLVIVYCQKGIRSQIAIQRLEQRGYTNLVNLQGGMEAFQK